MEGVVLNRVGILELFCPKQGQGFRPSAAPLHPNMDQVPPGGLAYAKLFLSETMRLR